MSIPLAEIRELSKNELVELVADLWEVRPGWRTIVVDPGDKLELEINGDPVDISIPDTKEPGLEDIEVPVDILAIQEEPYVELEYIHVRHGSEDEVIGDDHFYSFNQTSTGYQVTKSVIVTTGAGPSRTVDKRLYEGNKLVEGSDLCNLIEQYTEYGFDYDAYF